MPRYLVRQPNGKWAIWSTVVDHFIAYDSDKVQVAEEMRSAGYNCPDNIINEMFYNIWKTGVAWPGAKDWDRCLRTVRELHGANDETLLEIMAYLNDPNQKTA